jgi:SAM-dependent methyltransferase
VNKEAGKNLFKCQECGHGFLAPLVPHNYAKAFAGYKVRPPRFCEALSTHDLCWGRNTANLFVLQLFQEIDSDTVILEIGPGPGGIFEEIRRAGYDCACYAYEPCKNFLERLQSAGVHVLSQVFDSETIALFKQIRPDKANVVVSANQIYFNHDPLEQIRLMSDLLTPGGLLLLVVQNSSSKVDQLLETDNVMHWFSPESFGCLLDRSGLQIVFQSTCGAMRSAIESADRQALHPGFRQTGPIGMAIGKTLEAVNRLMARFRDEETGPWLYQYWFSPAVAMVRNQEFRYGSPGRYQLKALLRKRL